MSYITPREVEEMEEKYGVPREVELTLEITPAEFAMLRGSRKRERSHDITLFIFRDDSPRELAAIAKPFFPPGLYRAPSGAAHPGEGLEAGALREAREETGLEVALERFILKVRARFTCGPEFEDWTSYVFTARMTGGTLQQLDTEEISEVRWLSLQDLLGEVREKLRETGMPLFQYRLRLHDEAAREIIGTRDGEEEG